MELAQVENPTGLDQIVDDLRPARQVGKPGDRTLACVDDVEGTAAQGVDRVVHVGRDEVRINPDLPREPLRDLHSRRREVQSRHPCAATRPGKRVEAEVALKVNEFQPAHVAELLDLEHLERLLPRLERLHVVELAGSVNRHPLVPPVAVQVARHRGDRRVGPGIRRSA